MKYTNGPKVKCYLLGVEKLLDKAAVFPPIIMELPVVYVEVVGGEKKEEEQSTLIHEILGPHGGTQ